MTNTIDFADQAERDLYGTGKLAASTCQAWDGLSPASKAAFAPALNFLGCHAQGANGHSASATAEADRVAACRLMLTALYQVGVDPTWSSFMLDRLVATVMATPGGTVGDLFHALYGLLGNRPGALTEATANLIKQLVIMCFTRQRRSYEAVDWCWFAKQATAGATPAQLYFALHAVPPDYVNAPLTKAIRSALAASPYEAEVAAALAG